MSKLDVQVRCPGCGKIDKEKMENKKKFINPENKFLNARDFEGNPQTEQIKYAREFFEAFGRKDRRFSGAAILGSTVKGYGQLESSDIDVVLFYYGLKGRKSWDWCLNENFYKFKNSFNSKKQKGGERIFELDTSPGEYHLNIYKISPRNLATNASLIYQLSYPIISTPNPNALLSIEKFVDQLRKTITEASSEQKVLLFRRIITKAVHWFEKEFKKYSAKTGSPIEKKVYIHFRVDALKRRLKNKFGLSVALH